ncbi:MAG: group II intron reverse transcriptase/maturase [Pedobacter sp.]|nr:MAG: group II intron reverse transcriptase/maturase [Pedobacter sp.]
MKLFETEGSKGKTHDVTLEAVGAAYASVRRNDGACGVDGQSLQDFDMSKPGLLYKLWNRMSSGSYFPKAVRGVEILKMDGGKRMLGIPTVTDRIAQQVAVNVMEPVMEKVFHLDSYGYRPGKSAHQAIRQCLDRCHEYRWVLDIDIRGYFDNIDHELMLGVVAHYFSAPWLMLYIKRWLQSPMLLPDGSLIDRTKGTPQGGVISPLLSNMFLHVVFDAWMQSHHADKPSPGRVRWERYADDIVVHCKTERDAKHLLTLIRRRMASCKLELHPEKTKIVYCKQSDRWGNNGKVKFNFLGYEFSPSVVLCKDGRKRIAYRAKISNASKKNIVYYLERLKIHRATSLALPQIADRVKARLRGWIRYYSIFNPSALQEVFSKLNDRLVCWYTNKFKRFRRRTKEARQQLRADAQNFPNLFVHWQYGYTP